MSVNCPTCGKLYKSKHFVNHMKDKHGWTRAEAEIYYVAPLPENIPDVEMDLMQCPFCGVEIPSNLIVCWGCGECVDSHIRELAEMYRRG